MTFLSREFDKAEAKLAKNNPRGAVRHLEHAFYNTHHAESENEFARLESLLSQVAAVGVGGDWTQRAEKLLPLVAARRENWATSATGRSQTSTSSLASEPALPSSSPAPLVAGGNHLVYCSNCGQATSRRANFCSACGHQIPEKNDSAAGAPSRPLEDVAASDGTAHAAIAHRKRPLWQFVVPLLIVAAILAVVLVGTRGSSSSHQNPNYVDPTGQGRTAEQVAYQDGVGSSQGAGGSPKHNFDFCMSLSPQYKDIDEDAFIRGCHDGSGY